MFLSTYKNQNEKIKMENDNAKIKNNFKF